VTHAIITHLSIVAPFVYPIHFCGGSWAVLANAMTLCYGALCRVPTATSPATWGLSRQRPSGKTGAEHGERPCLFGG
jgi:hypothetical protein